MEIKQRTKNAYHHQMNVQAERYNETTSTRLRQYDAEHQDDWDQFVQPLNYWYNNQPQGTTGTTMLNLVITLSTP